MKNFFIVFFSSLLGVIISIVLVGLIFTLAVTSVIREAVGGEGIALEQLLPNSVLYMDLSSEIQERSGSNPFSGFDLSGNEKQSLDVILMSLKRAKSDTSIKGIYLKTGNMEGGFATLEEIRNALTDFKSSKKFIYAYSETYNQKSYYVASVADQIFLNPQGSLDWKGLSAQIMFFKNALEKMNVEIQIFRHGKYKSAVEPYFLDKMSENNRTQTEAFMNSIWASVVSGVSQSRGIPSEQLNSIADGLTIRKAADAVNNKLIDGLKYEDEVQQLIKERLKIKTGDKISFIKLAAYRKATRKEKADDKAENKVAVIYAVGEIEGGEGDDNTIGSDRIAKAIRDARTDSTIKAIVLRVNSPGGSALASDVMWREVTLAKKVKPVVVSMGDVAASGGYYISCSATRIFAHPNTITGSIGVFGVMPNAQRLLSEKLGINVDTVNTNKHSDLGTMFRPVSGEEMYYIQQSVEDVYGVFISRVADGRAIQLNQVDSIGQGRVWSGSDALKIKLVDELGGLEKAISYAAKTAKLSGDDYSIVAFPKKMNPIDKFFKDKEDEMELKWMKNNLGNNYRYFQAFQFLLKAEGVQARLPFEVIVY